MHRPELKLVFNAYQWAIREMLNLWAKTLKLLLIWRGQEDGYEKGKTEDNQVGCGQLFED